MKLYKSLLIVALAMCNNIANADGLKLSNKDFVCMAKNQYMEANGTSPRDYQLVTATVLTRSEKTGLSPCAVIAQKNQFSWVGKKTPSQRDVEVINDVHIPAVKQAVTLFQNGFLPKVTHFNRPFVRPQISHKSRLVESTKGHKYYYDPMWN